MKTVEKTNIRKEFATYIAQNITKTLFIRSALAILILSYFVYQDLALLKSMPSFYTRLPPLLLSLFLFFFHLFTGQKFIFPKARIWDVLGFLLVAMMSQKVWLQMVHGIGFSATSGLILVLFISSLEARAGLKLFVVFLIIPFSPLLLYCSVFLFFEPSKAQISELSNIFPIMIMAFVLNKIQAGLRYRVFKSMHQLEAEKEKSKQLYEETQTMNDDLLLKNEQIVAQHESISSSIRYAQKIQLAMLPSEQLFAHFFSEYFVFFKPRDVVSGDYYWAKKINKKIYFALADSTGHGVPGSMLSMLGISALERISGIDDQRKTAASILENLRIEIKKMLKQSHKTGKTGSAFLKDGMDIALCILDTETNRLEFSGAYNSVIIANKAETLTKLRGERQPIGIYPKEVPFTNQNIALQKGDTVYLFTDGFPDLFNKQGQKYTKKRLYRLLSGFRKENLQTQKKLLEEEFARWTADYKQLDDVSALAIRL